MAAERVPDANKPPRKSGWRAWLPSLFLLLVCLPAVLWVEIGFHKRLGGGGSAVELTRPPNHLTSVQIRFLDNASRQDIAFLATQLLDPQNPLGLSDEERLAARAHLVRMSDLADQHLFEMHRFLDAVDESTIVRYHELLKDPYGGMRMQWARPEVVATMMQQRYGDLDPDSVPTEPLPAGWTPEKDPRHELWRANFSGAEVDRISDLFLLMQVQNLAVFHLENAQERESPEQAAQFSGSLVRIQTLAPEMRQEWINLYHRFVMPSPERVSMIPIGARKPDLSYAELAAALRQAKAAP